MENRFIFKIKIWYYLELLTSETIKLLRSTKNKINKEKNGKTLHHLEVTEVALIHCNVVNNYYQQDPRVLYTSVPNKSDGQLLDISIKNFTFVKLLIQNFDTLEYGLLINLSKPLEIENKKTLF